MKILTNPKGISDSCENVLYKIWNLIEYDILNLKSNSILYDINEVDFNVKELKVEFTINKSNERRCYGEINLKGATISNNSLIGSSINLNIKIDEIDDKFIYGLVYQQIGMIMIIMILLNIKNL